MEEELPPNMPEPKGKEVIISVFADANLYHDHVSGRAVSGILIMLNKHLLIGIQRDKLLWKQLLMDQNSSVPGWLLTKQMKPDIC